MLRRADAPAAEVCQPAGSRLRYGRHMPTFRIKQAASLLGVSTDTLRRWADQGRVETTTDDTGRQAVDGTALARLAQEMAASANHLEGSMVVAQSARNRFPGLVTRVIRDGCHGPGRDPGRAAQVRVAAAVAGTARVPAGPGVARRRAGTHVRHSSVLLLIFCTGPLLSSRVRAGRKNAKAAGRHGDLNRITGGELEAVYIPVEHQRSDGRVAD
jgi:excisionase family DNA binding protein